MMNSVNPYQNMDAMQQLSQPKTSIDIQVNGGKSARTPSSNNSSQLPLENASLSAHGTGLKNKFISDQVAQIDALKEVYDDKSLKQMGIIECATCAGRTYVDGSNDPGVSFKTPTHVSPGQSYAAVASHEMEHVVNEQANARKEGGEVISQSVSIHMSICPECGTSYAAGGVTRTTVSRPSQQSEANTGILVDMKL